MDLMTWTIFFYIGKHSPPDDIGSNYYPMLGCYSSRDMAVIDQHLQWIRSTGAGTIAVSWLPRSLADSQGRSWDDLIPFLLDAAAKYDLKVD